ncbi:sialate O-acetylesterase [Mesoflavibacter sp. CH_XMU1404-2]|uniref:sialate O-acetylesterase n=1 Tax=Mesoflavibacter sp. CH_XMU1404-2 TaxID=3107766 RepID=UPI003008B235
MAIINTNNLKQYFLTGLKPTQQQFWNLIDSFRHKNDPVPASEVSGLQGLLDQKLDAELYVGKPIHKNYENITALTSDQSSQIEGYFYGIEDATGFQNITNGRVTVSYKGTTNGDETDYNLEWKETSGELVLVFTGQSNMNCIVEGQTGGGDTEINPNVEVWDDQQNEWVVADLDLYPFGERVSVGGNDISGNNNIAFHTAKRIQERTGKKIKILFKAFSGTSIDSWRLTNTTHGAWDLLSGIITDSGVTKLDGVFWFQGEADSNTAAALNENYSNKLIELITQFEDSGISVPNLPFIAAELDSQYRLNDVFYRYPEYLKYINKKYFTVIKTEDLPRLDTIHLTGQSIVSASYRYADAFGSLPIQINDVTDYYSKSLDTNGAFIDPNLRYVEVDISSASKNFTLPKLAYYNKLTIKVIGTSNLNFARINTQPTETYDDGTTTKIDLYGIGTEVTLISTKEGHKVVDEIIKDQTTREITGASTVTNLTFTKYSPKHVVVDGSDTGNVNITLPQHEDAKEFYIERVAGTTNNVNLLNASGAEIDNGGTYFTIPDGNLIRVYYSESASLYRWQTINN